MVFLKVPMLGGLSLLRNLVDHSKELSVELFKSSSQFFKVGIDVFVCKVSSLKPLFNNGLSWWAQQDSNLRPRDYESPARAIRLSAHATCDA